MYVHHVNDLLLNNRRAIVLRHFCTFRKSFKNYGLSINQTKIMHMKMTNEEFSNEVNNV